MWNSLLTCLAIGYIAVKEFSREFSNRDSGGTLRTRRGRGIDGVVPIPLDETYECTNLYPVG